MKPRPQGSSQEHSPAAASPATEPSAPDAQEDTQDDLPERETRRSSCPVVGIGGSAGALEAFEQFFRKMPADSGLAFVLVPHLDPTHKGIMPELLQRYTGMPVHQAAEGLPVLPNCVYVIPPNRDLGLLDGVLHLLEPSAPRGLRLPIDFFFRQLAADQAERAIGIVLSGMGSDGTLGLRAIKEQLGMAMVQDPATAKYDAMPRSAVGTGLADFVAPVDELPAKLLAYVGHRSRATSLPDPAKKTTQSALGRLLLLLRTRTGNDFSLYKRNTVLRRVDRRMSVHQIASLPDYVTYAQGQPAELELLFKELLIGVTSFFRDSTAFELLKERAIRPRLHLQQAAFRVWVPGCSTGEEAYSIAILLRECLDEEPQLQPKVQIYATDLDEEAIEFARQGLYPANVAADLSPDRLQRWFVKEGEGYRVRKHLREMLVFARQNVLADPPFTRLDLLCCRNVLIYLNAEVQKRLLPLFHYALSPGGFMLLGPSESLGPSAELFHPVDSHWKLYGRADVPTTYGGLQHFPSRMLPQETSAAPSGAPPATRVGTTLQDAVRQVVVDAVAPPIALVTEKGELLYTTQRTGRFLEPPVGSAHLNVFEMAREGLRLELALAVRRASSQQAEVELKGLSVKTNGERETVDVTVKPLAEHEALRGLLMIVFKDAPRPRRRGGKRSGADAASVALVASLERELAHMRESLQTTLEEMSTSQEELKSSNEELQSTNEELQSTNEELTTSKEELQSLNEELMTLNAELQAKNDELSLASADMRNLLNSIQIPTLFLDNQLRVKRFTSQATTLFSLIASDVGRPITDVVCHLQCDTLEADVRSVIDSLVPIERAVDGRDGRPFTMRAVPYRTLEDKIDGVVVTFVESVKRRHAEAELKQATEWLQHVLAGTLDGFVVYDRDFRFAHLGPTDLARLQESGRDPALLLGKVLWEESPELVGTPAEERLRHAMLHRERVAYEHQQGDRCYDVRAFPSLDGGIAVLSTDVTERKRGR
ncbi:MAG: PAS domain-containing protein [Deltaproteobacteria bacterium]|nr:PAS domain-containing protein [Deltaproteobacteria bacterium]